MSMYEIAVADGHQMERAAVLLPVLGSPAVTRFRDCWVEKNDDGPLITVYTRQGGPNRECFCEPGRARHIPEQCCAASNEMLAAHPLYVRDADDSYDSTYATFWFRVPDEYREALAEAAVEPVNMRERWLGAARRIQSGELRPAERAMMDRLSAMLGDPSPDAPRIMEI